MNVVLYCSGTSAVLQTFREYGRCTSAGLPKLNKRPRGLDALLGHLPDTNNLSQVYT